MDPVTIALSLAQFAPSIMRYFGVGEKPAAVADKVIEIAQQITGAKSPEEALAAMRADSQAAQQFDMAVLAADTDLQKAQLADVASARAREATIAASESAPMLNKVIVPVLALLIVIGGGAIMVASQNADVRMAANSMVMMVLGYYFGTSMGTVRANQTLRDTAARAGSRPTQP